MKKIGKKAFTGGLSNLFQAVLLLVMVSIVVGLGVIVLSNMQGISGISSVAANALGNGSAAIATVSTTWLSIIVIVVVVGLIISILLASFAFNKQ